MEQNDSILKDKKQYLRDKSAYISQIDGIKVVNPEVKEIEDMLWQEMQEDRARRVAKQIKLLQLQLGEDAHEKRAHGFKS